MKLISLTKGKAAIVDDEDYEWLSQFRWYALRKNSRKNYYAIRKEYPKGKRENVLYMHRDILRINGNRLLYADHINFNGLDNRRKNLRIASSAENARHRRKSKKTASQFKGVRFQNGKWAAKINQTYLGIFKSEKIAALAYDLKAKELFGKFAHTNLL